MQYRIIIPFVLVVLACAGCQTTGYRWIKHGGLPEDNILSVDYKGMHIDYCLVEDEPGCFYFEGVARSGGAHVMGNIRNAVFQLYLYDGDTPVKALKLYSQGKELDRDIYLRRTFTYAEYFDKVGIGWNIRYAN